MSTRSAGKVEILLTSRGAEQLRKELLSLGPAGEKAAKRLDRATKSAGPGLKLVDNTAKEARRSLDDLAGSAGPAGRILEGIGPAGKAAAVGIGAIALAGVASLKMARDAARDFDAMAKSADDLAVHTDTFQALRLEAQKASIDFGQVEAGLRQFVRASAEASQGRGELVEKLKAGHPALLKEIQLQETTEGKLNAVARALANAKSEQDKTLISTAAFGESGRSLIRILGDEEDAIAAMVDEARNMGFVIEESVLRNAEEMESKLSLAATAIDLQLKQAFIDLAPVLVSSAELAATFVGKMVDALDAIKDFKNEPLDPLGGVFEATGLDLLIEEEKLQKLLDKREKMAAKIARLEEAPASNSFAKADLSDLEGRLAGLDAKIAAARSQVDSAAERQAATRPSEDPAKPSARSGDAADRLAKYEAALKARTDAAKAAAEATRLLAEQDRLVAAIAEAALTPQEKYRAELEKLEAVRARLTEDQFSKQETRLAADRDKAVAALEKENAARARAAALIKTLGEVTTDVLKPQDLFNAAVRELNELKPYLTIEQYEARLQQLKKTLSEAEKEQERLNKRTAELKQIRESIKTDDENLADEIKRLEGLRSRTEGDGGLTQEEYSKAVKDATDRYKDLNKEGLRHLDILDQIAAGVSGQKGAWEELGETAIRILLEIAAKALLAGDAVSGSGSGGGIAESIIGAIFGGSSAGGGGGPSSGAAASASGGGSWVESLLKAVVGGSQNPVDVKSYGAAAAGFNEPAAKTSAGSTARAYTSAAQSLANDRAAGAVTLSVKNYGSPAQAEVKESFDAEGMRTIELKMFAIGKLSAVSAIRDGSADSAMGQRFRLSPKPGAIG